MGISGGRIPEQFGEDEDEQLEIELTGKLQSLP